MTEPKEVLVSQKKIPRFSYGDYVIVKYAEGNRDNEVKLLNTLCRITSEPKEIYNSGSYMYLLNGLHQYFNEKQLKPAFLEPKKIDVNQHRQRLHREFVNLVENMQIEDLRGLMADTMYVMHDLENEIDHARKTVGLIEALETLNTIKSNFVLMKESYECMKTSDGENSKREKERFEFFMSVIDRVIENNK